MAPPPAVRIPLMNATRNPKREKKQQGTRHDAGTNFSKQTPAASKFLLPKRQSAQARSQPLSQQLPNPSQQFQSTPRFSLPAAATRQPSSSTTPSAVNARFRAVHDSIDSSPEPPSNPPASSLGSPVDSFYERAASHTRSDSIGPETVPASQSPPQDQCHDGPAPKRRRVSISPEIDSSFQETSDLPAPSERDDPLSDSSGDAELESLGGFRSSSAGLASLVDMDSSPSRRVDPCRPQVGSYQHQHRHQHPPTFHRAPRFKAPEPPPSRPQYFLPDAFSPQRRGAKYVPGGLAAELRDWLVEVKGEAGESGVEGGDKIPLASASAGVAFSPVIEVHEACPGPGMWLVRGRRRTRAQTQQAVAKDETRIILAGEGRLFGLARGNDVLAGCAVQVLPPTWDIDLHDGKWSVACDWYVLEEGTA